MSTPEGRIITEIKDTLERIPGVYTWRNNTGGFRNNGRYVAYGKKGSGDYLGVIRGGRFLAIEAKPPGEKQNADQVLFQKEVEALGGLYILAEAGADIIEPINQAIKEGKK